MEYRMLGNTGLRVSIIGFGASPLGNEFGEVDPKECEVAVRTAIDCGINFFDVSPYYGRTLAEERLGAALGERRKDIVLATKCGRYGVDSFDFSAKRVFESVDESLHRLRTDYIDLFQAHDIEFGDCEQIVQDTVPAMRKLQEQGKIRFVGTTGFPVKMLADVVRRTNIDTVLSYSRYNLLNRDLDRWLAPVTEEKGIGLINASPLHMRILTAEGPPPWHPAPEEVKRAGKEIADLCSSHGVEPAMFALRFCLDYPRVASTLVGMSRREEVECNVKALRVPLDADLLRKVEQVAAPVQNIVWPCGRPENQD